MLNRNLILCRFICHFTQQLAAWWIQLLAVLVFQATHSLLLVSRYTFLIGLNVSFIFIPEPSALGYKCRLWIMRVLGFQWIRLTPEWFCYLEIYISARTICFFHQSVCLSRWFRIMSTWAWVDNLGYLTAKWGKCILFTHCLI